jgi:hypothetical protein
VVNGKAYLEELSTLHHTMLRYAHVQPQGRAAGAQAMEILGFPLTKSLQTDLQNSHLLTMRQQPAHDILLIESHVGHSQRQLAEHLQRLGARVAYQSLPAPLLWNWVEDVGKILVPSHILQAVTTWLAEVLP